jgi:hypothetical protein
MEHERQIGYWINELTAHSELSLVSKHVADLEGDQF